MNAGLAYPEGIAPGIMYEQVGRAAGDQRTNSTIAADVNAFFPHLKCEVPQLKLDLPPHNWTSSLPSASLSVMSTFCDKDAGINQIVRNPAVDLCPPRQLTGNTGSITCSGNIWLLYTMMDIQYNQTITSQSVSEQQVNASS